MECGALKGRFEVKRRYKEEDDEKKEQDKESFKVERNDDNDKKR
jgi:hypothetical protein